MDANGKATPTPGTIRNTPRRKPEPIGAEPRQQPPFTRFDRNGQATTDEFERERMGIAAKE
jgi:hypothetical protein